MVLLSLTEGRGVCINSLYLGHTGRASREEVGIIFAALLRAGFTFNNDIHDGLDRTGRRCAYYHPADYGAAQLAARWPVVECTTHGLNSGQRHLHATYSSSLRGSGQQKTRHPAGAHTPPVKISLPFVRLSKSPGGKESGGIRGTGKKGIKLRSGQKKKSYRRDGINSLTSEEKLWGVIALF
jgi:hypothetical protein